MAVTVRSWPCGRVDKGVERQIELVAGLPDVRHVAVMPDIHLGRVIPNGIAVATRQIVYPDLVGADIGCGIAAIGFQAIAADLPEADRPVVLEWLARAVPTIKHVPSGVDRNASIVNGLGELSDLSLAHAARRDGLYQLGTIGRGNHFLEIATDEQGRLWAIVHTGSRGIGQAIATHHLAAGAMPPGAVGNDVTRPALHGLGIDSAAGRAYFNDMAWACRYATANRVAILNAVADILEDRYGIPVDASSFLDSPHNTATIETVDNEPAVVHRKSVNHAASGRLGIVAGSMAVGCRIVTGLGNRDALMSSAHGAGRLMSRTEARERLGARDVEARMAGITYRRSLANTFRDEAPPAYREIHEVMQAQRDLVKTERTLSPIINDKRT